MKRLLYLFLIITLLLTSCVKEDLVKRTRVERIENERPDVVGEDNKYYDVKIYDKFGQWPLKEGETYYSSTIGTWFTVWWTDKGSQTYDHWYATGWTRVKPVDYGYYSSGNRDYLLSALSRLKYIGIDYITLDDTNGHWNDFGLIAKNMEKIFEISQELGPLAPQVAISTGAPLREGNLSQQKNELSAYNKLNKDYPDAYFHYHGKPLVIMYLAGSADKRIEDDRFTIRYGTGFISWQKHSPDQEIFETQGNWGWVFDIQNEGSEVLGVQPGYNKSHQGEKIAFFARENGKRYIEMWLAAIKANPEMIIIPSYNDHAEETGWEATEFVREPDSQNCDLGDPNADPYIYEKITEAYLALKYGYIDSFIYREESSTQAYLFKDNDLTKVNPSEDDLVIIIPDGYMEWEYNRNTVES